MNGEKIKARKKTSNKWFETQDSISYWDIIICITKKNIQCATLLTSMRR